MAERRSSAGVADARPGLRKRRRRDWWQRARRWLLVGLAVVLVVTGAVVVFFTPVFSLRQVTVQGVALLTVEQVRQRAAAPMGTPLARINTQQIADRVSALPQVESVRVDRAWPSSVTIDVVERTPVVQRLAGGEYQWVDRNGVVFHTTTAPKAGLPVVNTPTTDRRLLADLATVSSALTPQLKELVVGLKASSPDTISLALKDGRQVVWGSADDSGTKAQVATALLKVKARIYDVSSPANPTSR